MDRPTQAPLWPEELPEQPTPAPARLARGDVELIVGDARKVLASFPDDHFQCVVTSPPYWGLRDYGIEGQIGAETKVDDYIADLVALFGVVRQKLRPDGTLWLNIGDSYTSGGRTWRDSDAKNKGRGMDYRAPTPEGLKPKDLIGVPWKLAFALQADGWYLRTDIIWNKPNCQPESVKDRPTRSHEYVFLFSKSERYFTIGKRCWSRPRTRVSEARTAARCGTSTPNLTLALTLPCTPALWRVSACRRAQSPAIGCWTRSSAQGRPGSFAKSSVGIASV